MPTDGLRISSIEGTFTAETSQSHAHLCLVKYPYGIAKAAPPQKTVRPFELTKQYRIHAKHHR
jgi:hypothetical protein